MNSFPRQLMTVGGQFIPGFGKVPVINPATGEHFADAPQCSREQLDLAIAAARNAFPAWAAKPFSARQELVGRIADVLVENIDELKRLLTREQGKPHEDAVGEIMFSAHWCRTTADLVIPVHVVQDDAVRHGKTRRVPLGVVGAISPWNYPVALAMFKVAPALLAGNTVVLKPSPFTPLTTLRIGELLQDVLPPGVLNVISGANELGPWMTAHPGIDKIAFTGSTTTGRKVMESSSATLKRLTLELGGNDPAIVLPDVNVEGVAKKLFWAALRNNGQICMAAKRIYIHRDIYDSIKEEIVSYARTVNIGDGSVDGTQIGPVQNLPQYNRILELLDDSIAAGHKFLLGGERLNTPGYFVPITILDNPPEDSRIVQEEQFGPIIPLLQFDDVEDAVRRANNSEYGLCASVWSADPEKALEIGARLHAGTVWINEAQYLSPLSPFGGHKQSGIGVDGALEGLLEYTNAQTIFCLKQSAALAAAL